ncbi:DUF2771 family protein [Nocardia sp. 348MFTsu5.1]|uniref:DUF2771 family protein n=1 Tax=Nocardia sp. 348MFTsu5.1 TaxID=1172185 RepID=UPI00037E699F|nr:DUF2771 family protein [Nocardia sp. 348MFTsu5.1]
MSLSTGEKKFAIITAIVAVLFVAIVGGTVAALTVDHESSDVPYLQVASGSELVRVDPLKYCTIDLNSCEGSLDDPSSRVPVAVGDSAMVSVSEELSVGPWNLIAIYLTENGLEGSATSYSSGSKRTITLPSTKDRILAGFEVQQPSQIEVQGEGFIQRGLWSVDTRPDGVEVPATG